MTKFPKIHKSIWYNESEGQHVIADTGLNPGWSNAYMEGGSFSTPLLAGTVQYIADVVLTRGVPPGQFVDKVLDCVISSCDRNVDPESYEHRTREALTSFGPWSETWGYGVYSPWKALIRQ